MSLDLQHDFTFNPDGSGRVHVRWSGPLGDGAPTPDAFVRSELERARGVDAWADVACAPEDDRLVFTATAWFPDVRGLRFHCQGFHVNLLDFVVEAQADGSVVVRTAPGEGAAARGAGDGDGASGDIGPAQLADERAKLALARGFVDGLFGGLTCSAVLRLPGRLVGVVRGERVADDAVRLRCDGAELLAVLDRLMTDDALMTKLLRAGGLRPETALELLGEHGPVELRTEPGAEPQFDYVAEVAAARERFAAVAGDLQAALPSTAPAEPLANVRIVATKVVREADAERELSPQGHNRPGVTLTIAGDLPRAALELEEAGFTRAVADDGADFTPPEEWDRRCHFPKTTRDGRTVFVDVELQPPPGARGLRELTGRVTAVCSEGAEEHDLGFATLQAGAAGDVVGAQLLRCERDDDARWTFEVQLQVARQRVLGLAVVAGAERLPLEAAGYSSCNDECSLTYRLDAELPAGARLVATFAAQLSRTTFAFALHDVGWLGEPL